MSQSPANSSASAEEPPQRCPNCDAVILPDAERCLMCGLAVDPQLFATAPDPPLEETSEASPVDVAEEEVAAVELTEEAPPTAVPSTPAPLDPPAEEAPPPPPVEVELAPEKLTTFKRVPAEPDPLTPPTLSAPLPTQTFSLPRPLMLGLIGLLSAVVLCSLLLFFAPEQMQAALIITETPPPSATATATLQPSATLDPDLLAAQPEGPSPTPTLTITPTPLPTDTPQPPRFHSIQTGETLISISLFYRITADSIAQANGFNDNPIIVAGQEIEIPWPTPTPPLQPIAINVGEEQVVVDPSGCPPFYEIQEGDSLFGVSSRNKIPLEALLQINRLTIDSILKPGDRVCIPEIDLRAVIPPTAGPSPTPSNTPPPPAPDLLYPPDDWVVEAGEPVGLQWLAVRDLAVDEWYMVELIDMTDIDAPPLRGFTRSTAFPLPDRWRPTAGQPHRFSWRVRVVKVTGERADGGLIYTYGGRESQPSQFTWN